MASESLTCPVCGGLMRAGFLLEMNHKNPAVEVAEQMEWVAGEPGPASSWHGGLNLSGRERRKVVTYAGEGCGFLQSLAQPPSA
jgi:hypothetical protein